MLGERSQTQKALCCIIQFIWYPGKSKTIGIGSKSVIARGSGWEEQLTTKEYKEMIGVVELFYIFIRKGTFYVVIYTLITLTKKE